jgi:septal ring factor EnvC (AmiA/AmiB activator)
MREHFEAQTRSFRSQADSCAALAEAAKREGRGAGTHTAALKTLAEEVDMLGQKNMSAITNHGVTLNTLRASVDAHSSRLVALHKTVEGLRPPPHPAKDVSEAMVAVRSATSALERLALGELAAKTDTLASRTAAYKAEREKMAGEMAALRARCNEAEAAARTQIQAKDAEVRRLAAELEHTKEEMYKAKEEFYTATSRLCSKCTKRFDAQRTRRF